MDLVPGSAGHAALLLALDTAAKARAARKSRASAKSESEEEEDDESEDEGDAEEAAEVLFSLVAVGSGPGERDRELGSGAVSLQAIVESKRDVVSRAIEVVDESGGVRRPLGTLRVSVRALELLTTLKSSQARQRHSNTRAWTNVLLH